MKAASGGQQEHSGQSDFHARQPRCAWRLRELMAVRRNWYNTTKLVPELRRYGFDFDRSTVYRLVSAEQPPKIPLELVVALCRILDCRFEDLVVELDPEHGTDRSTKHGPAPAMPDGPVLSADFFDAES
ncbi:helix-turn-helix domain-containing protein [Saccharothrix syringae]|uniref:XRE family transcriptional regulator n=1 Tax=Saccharothrix syringae TaxID=103733 RepID=A0A5Q0H3S7_SACSY|nr:helix-turn-helix transcriptional regulator [Saccharothrix syringae]QFZ20544.1 XRE family transcriptional regulator [Saccharothrix syringae]